MDLYLESKKNYLIKKKIGGGNPDIIRKLIVSHGGVVFQHEKIVYKKLPKNFVLVSLCNFICPTDMEPINEDLIKAWEKFDKDTFKNFPLTTDISSELIESREKLCISSGNIKDINHYPDLHLTYDMGRKIPDDNQYGQYMSGYIIDLPFGQKPYLSMLGDVQNESLFNEYNDIILGLPEIGEELLELESEINQIKKDIADHVKRRSEINQDIDNIKGIMTLNKPRTVYMEEKENLQEKLQKKKKKNSIYRDLILEYEKELHQKENKREVLLELEQQMNRTAEKIIEKYFKDIGNYQIMIQLEKEKKEPINEVLIKDYQNKINELNKIIKIYRKTQFNKSHYIDVLSRGKSKSESDRVARLMKPSYLDILLGDTYREGKMDAHRANPELDRVNPDLNRLNHFLSKKKLMSPHKTIPNRKFIGDTTLSREIEKLRKENPGKFIILFVYACQGIERKFTMPIDEYERTWRETDQEIWEAGNESF